MELLLSLMLLMVTLSLISKSKFCQSASIKVFFVPFFISNKIFRWLQEITDNCEDLSRILVGNKCEDPGKRVVAYEDAFKVASKLGIQYLETSAKCNINVEEAFHAIAGLALNAKKAQMNDLDEDSPAIRKINVRPTEELRFEKSNKCCY